jgi:hypothetical protein
MTVIVPVAILAFGLTVVCANAVLFRRLLEDCPDVRQIADDTLRSQIIYQIQESFALSWPKAVFAKILPFALFLLVDWVLSYWATPSRLRISSLSCLMIKVAVVGCLVPAVTILLHRMARKELRRFIRRRLAQRGVLMCIHCGYDLRGQTVCRCPECGKPFDPKRLSLKKGALYAVDFWRGDK